MSLIPSSVTNTASDPEGAPGSVPDWHGAQLCHLLSFKPSSASHPAAPPAAQVLLFSRNHCGTQPAGSLTAFTTTHRKGAALPLHGFAVIISVTALVRITGHLSSYLQQVGAKALLPICHLPPNVDAWLFLFAECNCRWSLVKQPHWNR